MADARCSGATTRVSSAASTDGSATSVRGPVMTAGPLPIVAPVSPSTNSSSRKSSVQCSSTSSGNEAGPLPDGATGTSEPRNVTERTSPALAGTLYSRVRSYT